MYGHKARTAKDTDQLVHIGFLSPTSGALCTLTWTRKDPRTWSASPLLCLAIQERDASSDLIHHKSYPAIINIPQGID